MTPIQEPQVLPLDIRTPWLNVVRSMQAHARHQSGIAILDIKIFVNADGIPFGWTTPRCTTIEPKGNADMILEVLRNLG